MPGTRTSMPKGLNGQIVLTGEVASASEADQAVQLARTAVAKPELVIDMLHIAGKDQVMLKRSASSRCSATSSSSWVSTFRSAATIAGSKFSPVAKSVLRHQRRHPGRRYRHLLLHQQQSRQPVNQAEAAIQAFERVGLVRTLVEPTSPPVGRLAKFLAGGEFPVPTSESTTGQVSVEFKQFGVGLGFTPVVLSGGRIPPENLTRSEPAQQQGRLQPQHRRRRPGSGDPLAHRAARRNHCRVAVRWRDDDRRLAAGHLAAGHRIRRPG